MSKDLLKLTKDEKVNVKFFSDDNAKQKEIRQKFIDKLFGELDEETKKEIHFDQFMWHAFSYGKMSCLEREEAVKALKEKGASDVYIFFQRNNKVLTAKSLTYDLFLYLFNEYTSIDPDCYIVDKDFKWIFVFTHEVYTDWRYRNAYYIGPFFKSLE